MSGLHASHGEASASHVRGREGLGFRFSGQAADSVAAQSGPEGVEHQPLALLRAAAARSPHGSLSVFSSKIFGKI